MKGEAPKALYFIVADKQRRICGYTWRIGWGNTSFYIKSTYKPMSALKISLHGPDPRHKRPGFKIAVDEPAVSGAKNAGGGVYFGSAAVSPQWFSGHRISNDVTHVITFRTTWDLFVSGSPSAPGPGSLRKKATGLIVPAPRPTKLKFRFRTFFWRVISYEDMYARFGSAKNPRTFPGSF